MPRLPFRPDPYVVGILIAVAAAFLFPVSGVGAERFSLATKIAVAFLFFLYGARLPREVVLAGLVRWRLHLLVLSITFVVYPLIGFGWTFVPTTVLAAPLVAGLVFMSCVPSTVQSNVALVARARGDVAAAVCSASASNMIGVFLTPALVALLLHSDGAHISADAITGVFIQLLLPFIAGQFAHRWLGPTLERYKARLAYYDRVTIMMIVYSAFSAAVVAGVWKQVAPAQFALIFVICLTLFILIFNLAIRAARAAGFAVEDEIVVGICGTQKGMVAGVPIATLIFPPETVGLILLPLMIYHQIQLIGCALIAARYARREDAARSPA
jgi:solute carrier family 10 (sodium/bile acid cotransporter), member 7